MANLDGSRSHGGKYDILAGAVLRDEPAHFTHIYRTLLTAARAEGIHADRLPDFLGLEHDGEFDLLGQDELGPSALENAFKDQIAKAAAEGTWTEQQTERILLAAARVGQHLFALNVLANCGGRCVFCGLNPGPFGRQAHARSRAHQAVEGQHLRRAHGPPQRPGRLPQPRRGLRHRPAHRQHASLQVHVAPARWPTRSAPILSPGSTTGARRCCDDDPAPGPGPAARAASTSTGTASQRLRRLIRRRTRSYHGTPPGGAASAPTGPIACSSGVRQPTPLNARTRRHEPTIWPNATAGCRHLVRQLRLAADGMRPSVQP